MLFRREKRSEEVGINDPEFLKLLGIEPGEVNVKGINGLKVDTIYTCVRILSESLAKLPFKIYKENKQKAEDHYLYQLLKLRPNPYMSAYDFFKTLEAQRNIYGNSYASLEIDEKGRVIGIWPMDAPKVSVYVDEKGLLSSSNRIWYVVKVNGEERKLHPDSVLHFKALTTDGIVGIAPLEVLRANVENEAQGTEYINKFFKQGLQSKGIIHYVGDLSLEKEKEFIKRFEQMSSGLKNSHRVSMLPYGYQFQPLAASLADAQFLENAQLTIRKIAAAYGVKMHQLNDLERATYSNNSEQQRQFYVDTLMPILTSYEQEMTYKLFLDRELKQGYYGKFTVDVITRADIKTRYEAYRIGIQGGFIKPNEVRAREEFEPVEGGDELLINGNMMPIGMAGKQYMKGGGQNEPKS